jgi:hypothetical protein
MRRLTAWIGGTAAGIAAYRLLRRRPQAAVESPSSEPDARADELRAKLAESRVADPVEDPPAEPTAEKAPAVEPESPEERRRRVHDEGRAALDDMKSD